MSLRPKKGITRKPIIKGDVRWRKPTRKFGGETFCIVGTQSGRKDEEQRTVNRLKKEGIRTKLTYTKRFGWEAWGNVKDINALWAGTLKKPKRRKTK